ncbi:MAG: lipoyl synthase [Nitrospirota bacterium]|nr:MAG: lipoyl synthase [Nitrospirota bacterium]
MRLPEWLRTDTLTGLRETRKLLRSYGVSTVCEEARCPNRGYCFKKPTAAFMILGDRCTRNCCFCSVMPGVPSAPDGDEPQRIALAAKEMGLRYVVVTSVTRDDLPDGGAMHFVKTIRSIGAILPKALIEVLIPDFNGNSGSIGHVISAGPDVLNHNIETVRRLYDSVRPDADYDRSLSVLKEASSTAGNTLIKSGLMLGLGETSEEVIETMKDLRMSGCEMISIGQYLQPSKYNLPVKEYVRPEVFDRYRSVAKDMGFRFVASAPLVRSSMNAEELFLLSR